MLDAVFSRAASEEAAYLRAFSGPRRGRTCRATISARPRSRKGGRKRTSSSGGPGVTFDVTGETMLRYYTATEKKRTADEVLGDLAGDLLPKPKERGE